MFRFLLMAVFVLFNSLLNAQTQQDTIYTKYTSIPVVIDGSDSDLCWATATWYAIDQVWLPHVNDVMEEGDFAGKYKVAWDANYLYILVEVKDDVLSDDHIYPTDNYWNDDCVEIFIDEDRSMGYHETNNNAFAYHVSIFYDVIDNGMNLRNNLKVVMDTIAEKTYLWEFAVKIYDEDFIYNNSEASRVKLVPNKLMGFSIAYCDNDDAPNKERENFIGSMIMDETHKNVNYQTADYFGSMLLVDNDHSDISTFGSHTNDKLVSVYPNPATNTLLISQKIGDVVSYQIFFHSITGSLIRTMQINQLEQTIDIHDLEKGIYLINFLTDKYSQTERIVKN